MSSAKFSGIFKFTKEEDYNRALLCIPLKNTRRMVSGLSKPELGFMNNYYDFYFAKKLHEAGISLSDVEYTPMPTRTNVSPKTVIASEKFSAFA